MNLYLFLTATEKSQAVKLRGVMNVVVAPKSLCNYWFENTGVALLAPVAQYPYLTFL